MRTVLHGVVSRLTAERGMVDATSPAERQMLRREQDRAYWAAWQSNRSQLSEIHAMYARESTPTHR